MKQPVSRATSYVPGPSTLRIPLSSNDRLRHKLATIKANLMLAGLITQANIRAKVRP